jgi:hypothetical protein
MKPLDVSRINTEIAGISFSLSCRDAVIVQDADPAYESFVKRGEDLFFSDFDINLELNNMPDTGRWTKVFDSDQSWSLFQQNGEYFLAMKPEAFGRQPVWIARFRPHGSTITIYCSRFLMDQRDGVPTVLNPFRYPLDQLLLMYVLAQKGGAILHAAGITINEKGYMFLGRSGAGKSTLMRQCARRNYFQALSDDRIVVRMFDLTFKAFGTPWPGEVTVAENESVSLSGIFFISHGSENRIRELSRRDAFEGLLPVTSIPWYDREITEKLLSFCEDIVSHVPAYELCFKPGDEVVGVLEKFSQK